MEDARIRLDRAKASVEALKREMAKSQRPHADVEMVGKDEDGESRLRVVARVPGQPPKEWGLRFGDILVDLRCGLDYAVYALAVANTGQSPPPFDYALEFPICKNDPRRWREAIGRHKLAGVPQGAIDYIESIQAYQPGQGGDTSALLALDELVGVSKHRFVPVAWSRLDVADLPVRIVDCRVVRIQSYDHPGELEDGAVLADFYIVTTGPKPKIEMKARLLTFVATEPTTKGWIDISDFVGKVGAYIEHLIDELEPFLVPGHQAVPRTRIELRPW